MNSNFNYKRIITIVLVLLVWAAILLFFIDTKPIYGKWICNNSITVEFSRTRSFEVYNALRSDDKYIEGKYKSKRLKEKLPKIKYLITLESTIGYNTNYEKDLLIISSQTKLNEINIEDLTDKNTYTCKRLK